MSRTVQLAFDPPTEKQALFLADHHRHVAFGGARGGGKSWAVRNKAIRLCLAHRGIKVLIVRRTLPELRNNHANILIEDLWGIAKYNRQEKVFRFPNGSTISLDYCDHDGDVGHYQGMEYDVIFFDEATQLMEDWIRKINVCVRGANDFPKRTYYTCNPGGPSHGYIKRLFLDRRYEGNEVPDNYSFIQSLVTDNDVLMKKNPEYLAELESLPPKIRDAWLFGRWDIFEGQFFEDLRLEPDIEGCEQSGITPEEARQQRRWTHVIPPFDISSGECRGWNIMRSYDFGYNKPFSVGYWAIDYDGVLYRIAEIYGCTDTPNEGVKWTPDEQFRRVKAFEDEHPWFRGRTIVDSVADPAIWDSSRGDSVADTALKYGIAFSPGDNERIPGWMQVHYRLQFDDNGYPRMYVFDNCKAFIRTLPLMMYSKTRPEDLDTTLEDHVADEVRYMCMSKPVKPIIKAPKKVGWNSDPLNQYSTEKYRGIKFTR